MSQTLKPCYCGPAECHHPSTLREGYVCKVQLAVAPPVSGWREISEYMDDGEVIVWNGQQAYLAYYQDPDGWFADVDGELLRIVPEPTIWIRVPKALPDPPVDETAPETR